MSGWGFFFFLFFSLGRPVWWKFGLYLERGTTDDFMCEHGLERTDMVIFFMNTKGIWGGYLDESHHKRRVSIYAVRARYIHSR